MPGPSIVQLAPAITNCCILKSITGKFISLEVLKLNGYRRLQLIASRHKICRSKLI